MCGFYSGLFSALFLRDAINEKEILLFLVKIVCEKFFYGKKLFVEMFSFFVFMFIQADDEVLFPIFGPGLIS